MLDKCHVCDEPIRPGQDTRECMYCDRIGHLHCGDTPVDARPDQWACNACWEDIAADEEADAHVL